VIRRKRDCKSGGVVLVTALRRLRGERQKCVHVACGLKQGKRSVGEKGKTKCEERRK